MSDESKRSLILGVLLGGLLSLVISWAVSHWYYQMSGEDLNRAVHVLERYHIKTRGGIQALAHILDRDPNYKVEFDAEGDPVSISANASGEAPRMRLQAPPGTATGGPASGGPGD